MTKESGAWVVPTMILWETILGYTDLEWARTLPELRYMPQGTVSAVDNHAYKPCKQSEPES